MSEEEHIDQLSKFSDLPKLKKLVDWDQFRPTLDSVFGPPQNSNPNHHSWDYLIIFRALLLGELNGLNVNQLHYMLKDRFSYKYFVGHGSHGKIPNLNTLRKYRNKLIQSGCLEKMMEVFNKQLEAHGYILHNRKIVDPIAVRDPRKYLELRKI